MTKIEWASLGLPKGVTWNPIRARNAQTGKRGWHCEKVSPACEYCYAEALNAKAGDTGGTGLPYKPGHRQNGDTEIYLDEKTLLQPLSWRAPRGVFPCSMTDIFGPWVPDEWLDRIFAVMALCPQHRFAVLTKRPKRMRKYISGIQSKIPFLGRMPLERIHIEAAGHMEGDRGFMDEIKRVANPYSLYLDRPWPLPNVFLGATVEDQKRADERREAMCALAAMGWRIFVSYEPALGPVDFKGWEFVSQIIVGGESGPDARPMHPDWVRATLAFCRAHGIAFFFKQWGEWREAEHGDTFNTANGRAGHPPAFIIKPDGTVHCFMPDDDSGARAVIRVGKARAGRLLDGKEYSEFPEATP